MPICAMVDLSPKHVTSMYPYHIEHGDSGRVDDGQANSVLFQLSVWPSNVYHIEPADSGRVDDGQANSVLLE